MPTIRILDPAEGMKKFSYPGQIDKLSIADIKKFISDFKSGTLKAFLKSEDIPDYTDKVMKSVVGLNFQDLVIMNENDVFIKFYAPWCGHCKEMAPAWIELAEELRNVPGLLIADFDATANEADGVEVEGFPTIKFYPKGEKSTPIDFEGDRNIDEFRKYLKEHSEAYKKYLSSKNEEL